MFNFDTTKMDYRDYIRNWVIGSRRFMLKLDDDTLPEAKRKLNFLYWVDFVVKAAFFIGITFFLYNTYKSFTTLPEPKYTSKFPIDYINTIKT